MERKTQQSEIVKYLKTHKSGITQIQATELFGNTRLSSTIYNLRYKHHMNIKTEDKAVKNRYGGVSVVAVYKLVKDEVPSRA